MALNNTEHYMKGGDSNDKAGDSTFSYVIGKLLDTLVTATSSIVSICTESIKIRRPIMAHKYQLFWSNLKKKHFGNNNGKDNNHRALHYIARHLGRQAPIYTTDESGAKMLRNDLLARAFLFREE
jgi:hypothetical protein